MGLKSRARTTTAAATKAYAGTKAYAATKAYAGTKAYAATKGRADSKAYAAFDLDLTFGCFQHTNPLSYFWGTETLLPAAAKTLSESLLKSLRTAQLHFARALLKSHDLLPLVLRQNIDSFIRPLIFLRKRGRLGKVIIYSNSGVTSSLQLAADLIENKSPDNRALFSVLADANDPLRENDRRNSKNPGDPLKQFSTLQRLFVDTGLKPSQVLFVDDRDDHALQKQVEEGLTYIVVTPYITYPTTEERERLFYMAFDALHSQDLLNNEEYLESPFFRRQLHDGTRINNFMDVFLWIWKTMIEKPENNGVAGEWQDDTAALTTRMQEYLKKF